MTSLLKFNVALELSKPMGKTVKIEQFFVAQHNVKCAVVACQLSVYSCKP